MSVATKVHSDKQIAKRTAIANSALEALSESGYANTALRDIAAQSGMSLGSLHYYFEDRADLIIFCVRQYKERFVHDLTEALKRVKGREQIINMLSIALAHSIVTEAKTHRLWYDIRNQANFDDKLLPIVNEIESDLVGIIKLAGKRAGERKLGQIEYAVVDGLFRHLMVRKLNDTELDKERIADYFQNLLTSLI